GVFRLWDPKIAKSRLKAISPSRRRPDRAPTHRYPAEALEVDRAEWPLSGDRPPGGSPFQQRRARLLPNVPTAPVRLAHWRRSAFAREVRRLRRDAADRRKEG